MENVSLLYTIKLGEVLCPIPMTVCERFFVIFSDYHLTPILRAC